MVVSFTTRTEKEVIHIRKNIIRIIFAILILTISIHCHYMRIYRTVKQEQAAIELYETLIPYEFTSLRFNTENQSVLLFINSGKPSGIEKKEVTTLRMSPEAIEMIDRFKNICSLSEGLFFITKINTDNECTGIYINPSSKCPFDIKYISEQKENGVFLIENVPNPY